MCTRFVGGKMTEQNKQKGLEWQEKPLSDNERLKTDSNFLRGTILDDQDCQEAGCHQGNPAASGRNQQWRCQLA